METGLGDRVAFVSGGSGAIGSATALALAAEGASVAVSWCTDQARALRVVDTIGRSGGRAHAVHLDQRDPTSVTTALDEVRQRLGPITVLVANAVDWPSPDRSDLDGLADSLSANVLGTVALIDAVLADMRAEAWGRIVVVSTDVVGQPMPGPLAYSTAKGALETAARVLAVREAGVGILTNVVRPGFTLTDRALSSPHLSPAIDHEAARTPTGRICTPADVASAVTYLASGANSHINGQVVSAAGGRELVR